MTDSELKEFLDFKVEQYNNRNFIETDPIQIVHQFDKKEDIEIIGFLIATIAWGNRTSIIKNGERLVQLMQQRPHEFILEYKQTDLSFVHRTFNGLDLDFFFRSLKNIYENEGLEKSFKIDPNYPGMQGRILSFRNRFLETDHLVRSEKHLSNPAKNSAAKRINMFLRWMVRKDANNVDFGIWNEILPSELYLPLDVHTSNNARSLGLLKRKQNDWKALEELMLKLRQFDSVDPVKYDFALFGLGAFE